MQAASALTKVFMAEQGMSQFTGLPPADLRVLLLPAQMGLLHGVIACDPRRNDERQAQILSVIPLPIFMRFWEQVSGPEE